MWTETIRKEYERQNTRYASDMTDGEWALVAPHLPPAKPLGRPRTIDLRELVNALLSPLARLQVAHAADENSAKSTLYRYFTAWREDGAWCRIHRVLYSQRASRRGARHARARR